MPTLRVVDRDAKDVVYREDIAQNRHIPQRDNHIWVPENGDVAFRVHGVEHDYEAETVTLICARMEKKRFYE